MTLSPKVSEAPSAFEGFLAERPELLQLYRAFYSSLWENASIDPDVLAICRGRIAALHGCDAEFRLVYPGSNVTDYQIAELDSWETSTHFGPIERAALRLADRMPWNHHDITDAEVAEARQYLGEPATVALVVALALFDARCRLRIAFDLGAPAGEIPAPSAAGPLY